MDVFSSFWSGSSRPYFIKVGGEGTGPSVLPWPCHCIYCQIKAVKVKKISMVIELHASAYVRPFNFRLNGVVKISSTPTSKNYICVESLENIAKLALWDLSSSNFPYIWYFSCKHNTVLNIEVPSTCMRCCTKTQTFFLHLGLLLTPKWWLVRLAVSSNNRHFRKISENGDFWCVAFRVDRPKRISTFENGVGSSSLAWMNGWNLYCGKVHSFST